MGLIGQRLRDKRLLSLIRLVIASGGAEAQLDKPEATFVERVADFATGAANDVMTHMLGADFSGYGAGYAGYGGYQPIGESDATSPEDAAAEIRKTARREAYKRLGRDALLLGLTYIGRSRRLLSPASLALTGAAALVTAAYPKASRFVRERWGSGSRGVGAVQGSSLSPILLNIVMSEFDADMVKAGFHLVRYADGTPVQASN